ncbi:septum formation inhibitor Maf [uncultured Polaribacter sp.]|uniref:septum formation inhibitor Maf n=1 Tax=uncultured Polaribacter sp. TaxID=174711 RepID=UPI002628C93D|nr:septum formation inhibitor Maf [uncultured Polaribacter sp.]
MKISVSIITSILFIFCTSEKNKIQAQNQKKNFKDYWYQGKAEITSYKLKQSRYGEVYEGTAVNIYVTEDFLPEKQVKADVKSKSTIPVLKLNSTKKFVTGIYPYSLMTSTFSPINIDKNTIKISFSSQEWCGNTFAQLNNREKFEIDFHSYFENNTDRKIGLKKDILENELWNQLRLNPKNITIGRMKIIPSFEYLALNHKRIMAYDAETSLKEIKGFLYFSIFYPTLKRKLTIKLTKEFPYTIESWEEFLTINNTKLTTSATKIKTILSPYWRKNKKGNTEERKALGL